MRPTLIGVLLAIVLGANVQAQERIVTLVTTQATADSGLLEYILPRFKLKTGIAVEVVVDAGAATPDGADLILTDSSTDL